MTNSTSIAQFIEAATFANNLANNRDNLREQAKAIHAEINPTKVTSPTNMACFWAMAAYFEGHADTVKELIQKPGKHSEGGPYHKINGPVSRSLTLARAIKEKGKLRVGDRVFTPEYFATSEIPADIPSFQMVYKAWNEAEKKAREQKEAAEARTLEILEAFARTERGQQAFEEAEVKDAESFYSQMFAFGELGKLQAALEEGKAQLEREERDRAAASLRTELGNAAYLIQNNLADIESETLEALMRAIKDELDGRIAQRRTA